MGGEWRAEVYGDLWFPPQALIASSSVGSPGRPVVSSDQHRGSCRWAQPKRCLLSLVMETNGVTEGSETRWQTKTRKRKERRRTAGRWKGSGLSTWPSKNRKRELWEARLHWCTLNIYQWEWCCDKIVTARNIWTWSENIHFVMTGPKPGMGLCLWRANRFFFSFLSNNQVTAPFC